MAEAAPAKQPAKQSALKPAGFVLNVDERDIRFSALREIDNELEFAEHLGGTESPMTTKGVAKQRATMTLARDMTTDRSLATWQEQTADGGPAASGKPCELRVLGPEGDVVARYALESARPSRLEVRHVPERAALSEILTLLCSSIRRVDP